MHFDLALIHLMIITANKFAINVMTKIMILVTIVAIRIFSNQSVVVLVTVIASMKIKS